MGWVNIRPLVCGTTFARSAVAREARFSIEYIEFSIFDIFSLLWRTLDIFSTSTFLKLGGVGTDEEMYDADITPINKIVSDLT